MTDMRRLALLGLATTGCVLALAAPALAKKSGGAPAYKLVGSATLVSPGHNSTTAVEMASPGTTDPWGAIGFTVTSGLKLSQVTTLDTDYELRAGNCLGGAPRFTLGVAKGGSATTEIYFYFGRQPDGSISCPTGTWTTTGNVATPSFLVDTNALPGGSYSDPYSDVQTRYGGYSIKYIAIDVDGGWDAPQTVDIDNTQVNAALYTYEP
jgi:hypothetical protein